MEKSMGKEIAPLPRPSSEFPQWERTRKQGRSPSSSPSLPFQVGVTPRVHPWATTLGRGARSRKPRVQSCPFKRPPPPRLEAHAAPLRRGALWVRGVEFWNEM